MAKCRIATRAEIEDVQLTLLGLIDRADTSSSQEDIKIMPMMILDPIYVIGRSRHHRLPQEQRLWYRLQHLWIPSCFLSRQKILHHKVYCQKCLP